MYSAITVPDFYAGVAAGGEHDGCAGLHIGVGVAIDHIDCCDMIGGIQEITAIEWHGRTIGTRSITPTSGAFHASTRGCWGTTRLYLGEVESIRPRRLNAPATASYGK